MEIFDTLDEDENIMDSHLTIKLRGQEIKLDFSVINQMIGAPP